MENASVIFRIYNYFLYYRSSNKFGIWQSNFFYIFWKIGLINSILITIMISQNFVLLVEIQSMFWIWLRYRCSMSFSELSIQPYRFYKVQVAKNQHRLNKYIHFDFERTWWSLFQKRVVRTKLYIYVFITITGRYLCRWTIIPEGLIHPVASVST